MADRAEDTELVFEELRERGYIPFVENVKLEMSDICVFLALGWTTSISNLSTKSVRRNDYYVGTAEADDTEGFQSTKSQAQLLLVNVVGSRAEVAKKINTFIQERVVFLESEQNQDIKERE